MNRARAKGAKVVGIDPKRVKVAERADLHLALRPGTDAALALAVAAELERIGGVDHGFVGQWAVGYDDFMAGARRWEVERAAVACGVEAEAILPDRKRGVQGKSVSVRENSGALCK